MNTLSLNKISFINRLTISTTLLFILSLVLTLNTYGAGASSKSTSVSEPAYNKRERATTYFSKGEELQNQERYKEAAQQYAKAVKTDSSYAEAHSNLGFCYRKQGLFKKAVKSYKKAIKLDPKLAEAHEYLGEAYAEMGKFDMAEKELQILRDLGSGEASELEEFIARMKSQ
jgi:tetratricopeptide (TPR) repeat protein